MRRTVRGLLTLACVTIGVLAGACAPAAPSPTRYAAAHEIDPPIPATDFVLTAPDGERAALSDFRGRYVVIYFGYTHCPDVCPTTLGTFGAAFRTLPPEVRERYRFVMVTVDPRRDTPEVMSRYVAHFAPDFVGLSGTQAETDEFIRTWRLPVECGEVQPDGSYSVGHPASAWVLDPQGRQRLHVPFSATPQQVSADLQQLIRKG